MVTMVEIVAEFNYWSYGRYSEIPWPLGPR